MLELLDLEIGFLFQPTHVILVLSFAFLNLKVESRYCDLIAPNKVGVFEFLLFEEVCLLLELSEECVSLRFELSNLEIQEVYLLGEVSVLLNQFVVCSAITR